MFWFEKKAEEIEDPKKFIVTVLRKFVRVHAGSGGVQLGRYIVDIENPFIKRRFVATVDELAGETTEDWIREELEFTQKVLKTWKREAVVAKSAASAG